MGKKILEVSQELLVQLLNPSPGGDRAYSNDWPDDARIVDTRMILESPGVVQLLVESKEWEETPAGQERDRFRPTYQRPSHSLVAELFATKCGNCGKIHTGMC